MSQDNDLAIVWNIYGEAVLRWKSENIAKFIGKYTDPEAAAKIMQEICLENDEHAIQNGKIIEEMKNENTTT